MNELSEFINDKMRILLTIYEHQISVDGVLFCPLSQQEIATLIHCGKVKVNLLINELIKEGYLETLRIKGRYRLTNKAEEAIKKIR